MNRVTVTLPHVTYTQLKRLAKRDGVSVSQYVTYAIAKQVEQVETGQAIQASQAANTTTQADDENASTPTENAISGAEK
ncbi:MAG: hypothetical protein AAFQ63_01880 [Cyanobacteria bacterium J06621_11]